MSFSFCIPHNGLAERRSDACSNEAIKRMISWSDCPVPGRVRISVTAGWPSVSVPVLSITIVVIRLVR